MSKKFGVFYTPQVLVDFLISHLSASLCGRTEVSILEPSAGDGRFVETITSSFPDVIFNSTLVELNEETICFLKEKFPSSDKYEVVGSDFLFYESEKKFDLIIGNPPYISKKHLSSEQIVQSRKILSSNNIPLFTDKNIWTSFIVKSYTKLSDKGILAFVLPFDLLQVKFGTYIQRFLSENFERIDIFTLKKLVFKSAEQDTIVLLAYRKHCEPGLYINEAALDVVGNNKSHVLYQRKQNCRELIVSENNVKWSSLVLSDEDLFFLRGISSEMKTMGELVISRPGIVTAANDFFIVNQSTVQEFMLDEYARPILQKGQFVSGRVIFDKHDFNTLVENENPAFFLNFSDYNENSSPYIERYLSNGEDREIHMRYKCQRRKRWYDVPVVEAGQGFFFKRCYAYPKLLSNVANVYATDSAYNIVMRQNVEIESLIYSFYNPLTLCFSELFGRYYGGGVLELVPNEFRRLPIPYVSISKDEFASYSESFDSKLSIDDILFSYGRESLSSFMNDQDYDKVMNIYKKLMARRLKV